MKSGFISILGKPNVGKSSLINKLVGEKVSIVTPKPQTTRDRILGILSGEGYQMIFIDTPGVHTPKSLLGRHMGQAIKSAASDADAVVIVLDATKRLRDDDLEFIEKTLSRPFPVYIAVNKIDLAGYQQTYPILSALSVFMNADEKRAAVKEVIPVSAKTGENLEKLKQYLLQDLPEGEAFFPADDFTDKTERFQICEIIREKALLYLRDEIPHGVGVAIQAMKDAVIEADIYVEKDSHKQIVIGEGGGQLKTIGEKARFDIEKMLGRKVFLKLFVKVRKDWRNKQSYMDDIGYSKK